MKDHIRSLLQENLFVSGQEIAEKLGVSRAAIAKAVTKLRAEGYEIDAVPNRGYCLRKKPDVLDKAEILSLLAEHPWRQQIEVYKSVDSTNNLLRRMAAEGAPEGTTAIAECQTAGRGRMGRSFVSDAGVGIYLSVLLRPTGTPESLMTLTAQAAVAVRRAIVRVCGVSPDIKWVNDLLLGDRKICGILTELSVEAETARVAYAIVGVGVNCNQAISDFPEELRSIAGSISSESGIHVNRNALAAEMVRQLSALPALDWLDEYRENCATLGKAVRVISGDEEKLGRALEIGQQAELIVAYENGTIAAVHSGEVQVRPKQAEL